MMTSLQSQDPLKVHITAEEMDQIPGFREQIDTLYLWMEKECARDPSAGNELSVLYARTIYRLLERNFTVAEPKPKADRKEFYKIVEYVNAHFTENINGWEEFEELIDNCTWEWTPVNGHAGYLVTSKRNGNTLFFPASGNRDGSALNNRGSNGNYWSSSFNNATNAFNLNFNSGNVNPANNNNRRNGLTIRPVQHSSERAQKRRPHNRRKQRIILRKNGRIQANTPATALRPICSILRRCTA